MTGSRSTLAGNTFAGTTASSYASFRRDVPAPLIDAIAEATGLSDDDVALDLGCGTGQLAVPLSHRAKAVLALDPEPDMLAGLRARVDALGVSNVLPVLASDGDLDLIETMYGGRLAVIAVANALHWMDAQRVFLRSRALLRDGGGLAIVSQGPPMWLSGAAWSRQLRAFLERWTGSPVEDHCGTDRAALDARVGLLEAAGYERIEVVEHSYETAVDVAYVEGHVRSAMSESVLPPERHGEFADRLSADLEPHCENGLLIERIDATALIAIRA